MANGRCRIHGGTSLGGLASPTFKTGRYSKYLPVRLVSRYHEAITDPDLVALRDELGLLDTRIVQVVSALDTGESREAWAALVSAWSTLEEQFERALDTGEIPEEMERTVESIGTLIRSGMSEGYVWQEIRGLIKDRALLVAGEQKRLVEMQQYVKVDQAMTFVSAVMDSVRRHVHDTDVLAAIGTDLGRFTDVRDGSQPVASPAS